MPITKLARLACLVLLPGCALSNPNVNRTSPASGVELLQRMHDAYDGKWYKTVTFVQKTTLTRPNGVVDTSTWYEALQSPARLRIDFGDPAAGNGALYTADSLYVVRGGKITRTVASGNPFLPFVAVSTINRSRPRSDSWRRTISISHEFAPIPGWASPSTSSVRHRPTISTPRNSGSSAIVCSQCGFL